MDAVRFDRPHNSILIMNIVDFKNECQSNLQCHQLDYLSIESIADHLVALRNAGCTVTVKRNYNDVEKITDAYGGCGGSRGPAGPNGWYDKTPPRKMGPAPFDHIPYGHGNRVALKCIDVAISIYSLKDLDSQVVSSLALHKRETSLYEKVQEITNVIGNDKFYRRLESEPEITAAQLYTKLCDEATVNFWNMIEEYKDMGLEIYDICIWSDSNIIYNAEYMELTKDTVEPDKVLGSRVNTERRTLDYVGYEYSITVTADRLAEVADRLITALTN